MYKENIIDINKKVCNKVIVIDTEVETGDY